MPDDGLAQKCARAEQRAESAHEPWLFDERFYVDARDREVGEERREEARRLLGVGRIGESIDKATGEGGLAVARRGAQRPVRGARQRDEMTWEVGRRGRAETRDGCGGGRGLVEFVQRSPEPRQRWVRRGIAAQRSESPRDSRAHRGEVAAECLFIGVPQRACDAPPQLGVPRQGVRLEAGRELHAVLEAAQEEVTLRELDPLALVDEAAGAQAPQSVEGVRAADPRLAATPNQLQRLSKELDLANSAGPELQVLARSGARLGAPTGQQRGHLVRDPWVDRAPPHEGRQRLQQHAAEAQVSGHGPRADKGGALPRAPPGLVISLRGSERVDERPTGPLRAQPQNRPSIRPRRPWTPRESPRSAEPPARSIRAASIRRRSHRRFRRRGRGRCRSRH